MQDVKYPKPCAQQSPLNQKAKQQVLISLSKLDAVPDEKWRDVLVSAAVKGCRFPKELDQKLGPLQSSYAAFAHNEVMHSHLRTGIELYCQTEGLSQFKRCIAEFTLQQTNLDEWQSTLLRELAVYFNINLASSQLVDVAFSSAKVCWRLYQGSPDKLIHCNVKQFEFTAENSVTMTLEQFIQFKNSGKRGGGNRITLERFLRCFNQFEQAQAQQIWQELHQKQVLTQKHRLSDGWQLLCSDTLKLDAIALGAITYKNVCDALNAVMQREDYAKLTLGEGAPSFFRAPRDIKQWAETGLVQNSAPRTEARMSKLWDVSPKKNLGYHRVTKREEALYGEKLNYDHVPSDSLMTEFKQHQVGNYHHYSNERNALDAQLQHLYHQIDQLFFQLVGVAYKSAGSSPHIKFDFKTTLWVSAQGQDQSIVQSLAIFSRPEFGALMQSLSQLLIKINTHDFCSALNREDGDSWYAIALPEALHKQGRTYLKAKSEHSDEFPMYADIVWYFNILRTRPGDFRLQPKDCLEALGAFRYLFRMNTTFRQCQEGLVYIEHRQNEKKWLYKGSCLPMFFHCSVTLELKQKFDQLMLDELRGFLQRTHGLPEMGEGRTLEPSQHTKAVLKH